MDSFTAAHYNLLNAEQKKAVDTIDGPVLVLAGPGTGKTQLLSARVANILRHDNSPGNILCLTFTESAAQNMRERLLGMIGPAAYEVHISTYHGFGSDIIRSNPEYFEKLATDRTDDERMEKPIEELRRFELVSSIIDRLPYNHPLLSARYYVKSVISTISDLKRQAISPKKLRELALGNLADINNIQPKIDAAINNKGGLSRKKAEARHQYDQLYDALSNFSQGGLGGQARQELAAALELADANNSTTPLTKWKNTWLHKNDHDHYTLTDPKVSLKMTGLADIYEQYRATMRRAGTFDFDDMILNVIQAIQDNDELRFNLQERYQYILLDEFQDTNPAQFQLVDLIAQHPVHEGRPNIMAVGDDDQAIYAFQGANVGNMSQFLKSYRHVSVINLQENYRSHADILHTARNVAEQISDRLHTSMNGIEKSLRASGQRLPTDATIERKQFLTKAGEYSWIANQISKQLAGGTPPHEIAVLAPKHALLEDLVPFLNHEQIPVSYEKRENVLQTPIIRMLVLCAELTRALAHQNRPEANRLFPIVLSMPSFAASVIDIWKVNWALAAEPDKQWAELALDNEHLSRHVQFFLKLASLSEYESLNHMIDTILGVLPVAIEDGYQYRSGLKEYFFSEKKLQESPQEYTETIAELSVLRAKLNEFQDNAEAPSTLNTLLEMVKLYESAEMQLINSHPINQASSSVQLLTAYKAKGLEFSTVFIISAHNDVWGSSAKRSSNKLSLPANLTYIRYSSQDEDERKRLLFVAITRAKHCLYICSHMQKDNGRYNEPIKYLLEEDDTAGVLPDKHAVIQKHSTENTSVITQVTPLWNQQTVYPADLKNLIGERLANYQMSPTHLNKFIDLENGGPTEFLIGTLLRFPQSATNASEFGTSMHNSLEWYQNQLNSGETPTIERTLNYFKQDIRKRFIAEHDLLEIEKRGSEGLRAYLEQRQDMFKRRAKTEVNFRQEGVLVGNARLSGKIDRLEINERDKTIHIADYKTGAAHSKWKPTTLKLLKYEQQLYMYKLLIEGSQSFKGYSVASARLEFIEPDYSTLQITPPLYIDFSENKTTDLKKLIEHVWRCIMELDFPDCSRFDPTLSGSKAFIASLLTEPKEPQ